jgi:pyruvate carboxylase subunit B
VAKGGFGTSVTPVSQFYFQQAFANVTQGPWKKITDGYGNMVLGYFGKTPVEPDEEVVKIAEEQLGKPRFDGNPLDILEPGIPKAKAILEKEGLDVTDENIFIVGALETPGGNKGLDFLKGNFSINVRKNVEEQASKPAAKSKGTGGFENFVVTVNGEDYNVSVKEGTADVQSYQEVKTVEQKTQPAAAPTGDVVEVVSSVPGNVYKVAVKVGDSVNENDTLLILEAMKMETPVASPAVGTIAAIDVEQGDVVEAGQRLLTISR